MNWKDNPNLFANGKFKIERWGEEYTPHAFIHDNNGKLGIAIYPLDSECQTSWILLDKDIILIARPISDMSDDEVMSISKKVIGTPETLKEIWEYKAAVEPKNLSFGVVKHLLDHGVYPGKQRNTEDVKLRGRNG